MSLTNNTQTVVAFKNILGKSNTDVTKNIYNEADGLFFNVDSGNVWIVPPNQNPNIMVSSGDAVFISADLVLDTTSNDHAFFSIWPTNPPIGIDVKTNNPFEYGVGTLVNIFAGDRIKNTIPPSYGSAYEAKPFLGQEPISLGDVRNWIYQYNSGIFFQQDLIGNIPTRVDIYVYTGPLLSDQSLDSFYTNIQVYATNPNSYIGVAIPSITSYSPNHLYFITFDEVNTDDITLSIDGLDSYPIIRYGENGNILQITNQEIVTNQTYYLIWDGTYFQMFLTNPSSTSPIKYTNPLNVPNDHPVEHMRGLTFQEQTMKQMWDILLYPQQISNFTSFSFNHNGDIREVGDSIESGTYSFTWVTNNQANILTNTINILDVSSSQILLSDSENDGIEELFIDTITKNEPSIHKWLISANRTNGTIMKYEHIVTWVWKRYYGSSMISNITTENDIISIVSNLQNELSEEIIGNYNFSQGGYKYFSWPIDYNEPILFKDSRTNLVISMADESDGYEILVGNNYAIQYSLTNQFGESTDYYLFRSKNMLGGEITIVVS
jgi:hypothetical protein